MGTPAPTIEPMALADWPALIERAFPAQKVSAEAQKERKAVQSQTLTGLGSYWKGRKPLIMVRAIVLASLLPATDDTEADLDVFEKLMAIDDAAFGRREPKLKPADVAAAVRLENPWDFFDYTVKGEKTSEEEVTALTFPVDLSLYPGLSIRWKRNIAPADKEELLAEALHGLTYEEKVGLVKRPEECDQETLYRPIWADVNAHLAQFGIEVKSHEALVEQLGQLRYGHRPRVGDTFCGGGSIPFEAARLGCDVYASDLNPVACMLTWGALNIIGASPERRDIIEAEQTRVAEVVDRKITELGIEHNERGDRAKAYLYCLEVECPETGWMVPLAPSWVISKTRGVVGELIANHEEKRFDIAIRSGVSKQAMETAEKGTVQNGSLVYSLEGETYRTPIKTLRGDYRDADGVNRNRLRLWEKEDFKPRPDDIFQERLYCIQWIKKETLGRSRPETYFASITEEDLERERQVEAIVAKNLERWQDEGLVPDMPIEPGYNTDQPIRERGWQYWHHFFDARSVLALALTKEKMIESSESESLLIGFSKQLDWLNKGCYFGTGAARESISHIFSNQALNTLFNYGVRSAYSCYSIWRITAKISDPIKTSHTVQSTNAESVSRASDMWITDPPYADAINYHEITEFFIAWLRKNPPAPFDEWTWDSRRALAIKGEGDDFRRSMVDAYKAMANHMPDNGLQCVMFTHQDTSVWGDMVSIFWAAGLQVVGAWYIATETSTALRDGAHVQGTVTLILRKRQGSGATFKPQLLPEIRREVGRQVDDMMRLNEQARGHGRSIFSDADLQMAGYAAALKVLTSYTEVDGRNVTALALQPRQKNQKNVVDEIVEYAAEIANNKLTPERLLELNRQTWESVSPAERLYLRLLAIERGGTSKLDNYQNFAKAFGVDYQPLMASTTPNNARMKGPMDFRPRELAGGVLADTSLGGVLIGLQELLDDKEPKSVVAGLRAAMESAFFQQREHMAAIAQFYSEMVGDNRPEEAEKAEILANRIRNEGF